MTDRDRLAEDISAWGEVSGCEALADCLIALGWTRLDGTPEKLEAAAGRLLLASGKARAERMGPNDAHELRHLLAIIETGNSDGCEGAFCALDGQIKALATLDEERLARALTEVQGGAYASWLGRAPMIAKAYREDEG